jgi:hypothetical protein
MNNMGSQLSRANHLDARSLHSHSVVGSLSLSLSVALSLNPQAILTPLYLVFSKRGTAENLMIQDLNKVDNSESLLAFEI